MVDATLIAPEPNVGMRVVLHKIHLSGVALAIIF